jgi:predicted nucleic acid-binding protein
MPTNEVFLDTSYAIALASPKDTYHVRAEALADRLEQSRTRLVTTRAVLLEIGGALARQRYRSASVALLDAVERDPSVEIIPLSESLLCESVATLSGPDGQRAEFDGLYLFLGYTRSRSHRSAYDGRALPTSWISRSFARMGGRDAVSAVPL